MNEIPAIHRCEDSGTYQLRQEIPTELHGLVGKKRIRRSLNTRDEGEAKRLAADYTAEYEQLFERMIDDTGKPVDAGIFSYLLYCCRDRL